MDGVDAPHGSIFELAGHVGTVLQDPDGQFIGLTVGEDIAFALENSCTPQDEMHEITAALPGWSASRTTSTTLRTSFPAARSSASALRASWSTR